MTPPRLNVGCGPSPPSGWTNADLSDYGQAAHGGFHGDIRHGLPYPDAMFAVAVAHHSLQMIPYVDMVTTLQEIHRVLMPGGLLRVSVPDLRGAFDAWRSGQASWFPIVPEAEKFVGGKLCAYVTWYSEARTVFTRGWLVELCVRAGFSQVAVCCAGLSFLDDTAVSCALDSRPNESIYVEARA